MHIESFPTPMSWLLGVSVRVLSSQPHPGTAAESGRSSRGEGVSSHTLGGRLGARPSRGPPLGYLAHKVGLCLLLQREIK